MTEISGTTPAAEKLCGRTINVLTVEENRVVQSEQSPSLLKECAAWKLSRTGVAQFFSHSHEISAADRYRLYYYLPCDIKGTLKRNDTVFTYAINAGATAELWYKDSIYAYYGCSDPVCEDSMLLTSDGMQGE